MGFDQRSVLDLQLGNILHECLILVSEFFHLCTKGADSQVPVFLDLVDSHQLALVDLGLLEERFVSLLQARTFVPILIFKIDVLCKGQLEVPFLGRKSVDQSLLRLLHQLDLHDLLLGLLDFQVFIFDCVICTCQLLLQVVDLARLLLIFCLQ